MKQETLDLLLNLNRDFYEVYAKSFSSSRFSIQPGIRRLLPQILHTQNLLDLGCGNGNLAKVLLEEGFSGQYLGIDNSSSLLASAAKSIPEDLRDRFVFQQMDLPVQLETLSGKPAYDTIASFAVIHHFPVDPYLVRFFDFVEKNLVPNGRFLLSTWQVKNSQRLCDRIQPWSVLGVNHQELSEDDLLLDWRADPNQPPHYRYVHHYDAEALKKAGLSTGLKLENEFYSDGKEGDLALYQVWSKPVD